MEEGELCQGQIVLSEEIFNTDSKFRIEKIDKKSTHIWVVEFKSLNDPDDIRSELINRNKLKLLQLIQSEEFSGNPDLVILGIQARLIRLFQYTDKIIDTPMDFDPLPHQELAVLQMLELFPIRFMLADEAGAGKTIMAGMLYKQLSARKQADRTLIVVPPILIDKWIKEFKTKFNETLYRMDSSYIRNNSVDAWQVGRPIKAVASIDLLKRDEIRETLKLVKWDLVIIDESHKMTARILESLNHADKIFKTSRYKLGEIIAEKTSNLLLMTATPHRGEQDVFSFLMSLLDPLAMDHVNAKQMKELIQAQSRLSRHRFLRRMKEQMVTNDNKRLFPPRTTKTLTFSLSENDPLGYELYQEINDYIRDVYGKGIQNPDSKVRVVIGFVKQIFQRRLASSTFAVYRSLQNRLDKVNNFLNNFKQEEDEIELTEEFINSFGDMDEDDRDTTEQNFTGRIIILDQNDLEMEKNVLEKLIDKSEIVLNTSDPKIEQLKNALNEHPNTKIVIFTEYKDTLDYIKRRLPGHNSVSIDGSVKFSERTRIMEDFWIPLEDGGPRILVGTDAAGEGIDLQISTVLINYDIPWNPNRLEQRMGRIHRIGQEYPVLFVNIVAADTQEGQVLSTLLRKLDLIGQTIGEEKVFDVISELISEKSISQMMKNVLDGKSLQEINKELDNEIEMNKQHIDREELSIVNLDYELQFRQLNKRLTPEYTQSFLYKSLNYLQAEITRNEDGFNITKLPDIFIHHPDFRELDLPLIINLRNKRVSNQINLLSKSFKVILNHIQSITAFDIEKGTYLFDPYSKEPYVLWFFEIALTRKNEEIDKRVIAIKSIGNEPLNYDPRGVINLRSGNKDDFKDLDLQKYQSLINENTENQIWEVLLIFADKYKSDFIQPLDELWTARILAATEKQRYYSNLVVKNRKNKFRRASADEKYKKAQQELQQLESEKEMDLRMNLITPSLFSKIIVLPKIKNNQINVDVEARSMEYALKYELEQGRLPIDVSLMGRGCDIESAPPNNTGNTRYIEVKGRSPGVQVMLEETELIKAERFGDRYWLYLYVFNEDGSVEFSDVQNPISKLPLKQIIRSSVSISDIKKASKIRE